MFDWFTTLPLLGRLWLLYALVAVSLLASATYLEFSGRQRVDGAGGWMLFGAIMLSFWGLVLTALASLAILLLRWLF